jgi:TPR repeat protein
MLNGKGLHVFTPSKLALATILSLAFTQLSAQDFDKGLEAAMVGDFSAALQEWKPLAEQGDAKSQYNLAHMYRMGAGVMQDNVEALKWFRAAAEQGEPSAQTTLGTYYDNGEFVIQDFEIAEKWFRLGATGGDAHGQYKLGQLYEFGRGLPKSIFIASMWYSIAAANHHEIAIEWRDDLFGMMTDDDVVRAKEMARECIGSNYQSCGH